MRISNSRLKPVTLLIFGLSGLLILLDLIISGVSGSIGEYFENRFLSMSGAVGILALIFLGNQYFEYDSDGEVLIFNSKNILFGWLFRRVNTLTEFPKRKLHSYKTSGFIKKKLHIYIASKNHSLIHHTFNITYLNNQERRNLLRSLDRTLKTNLSESETQ